MSVIYTRRSAAIRRSVGASRYRVGVPARNTDMCVP